jgi:hypothetical protein
LSLVFVNRDRIELRCNKAFSRAAAHQRAVSEDRGGQDLKYLDVHGSSAEMKERALNMYEDPEIWEHRVGILPRCKDNEKLMKS